jgi:hypothetical protein
MLACEAVLTSGGTRMNQMDADYRTLHIRCGSDIREPLRAAGFGGDFLEYSDPICQGPVPEGPGLLERRAAFLADSYGWFKGQGAAEFLVGLQDAERHVMEAHRYERVVLWFEHDSYDQLILARCLARFAESPLPTHLELICIDRHPSVARFIGLGQLGPAELAALWPGRVAVMRDQLALGRAIWAGLRRSDPSELAGIAATNTPALPIAAPALRRHLQELPWADGLSLTQRLVLQVLAEAPTHIGRIFAAFQQGLEPLPFLGDIGMLGVVKEMALAEPPVLTVEAGEQHSFTRIATITETGRHVLSGELDYLSLRPPERWVGGVTVDRRWRWDDVVSVG